MTTSKRNNKISREGILEDRNIEYTIIELLFEQFGISHVTELFIDSYENGEGIFSRD